MKVGHPEISFIEEIPEQPLRAKFDPEGRFNPYMGRVS
jgi:hypothetical protein